MHKLRNNIRGVSPIIATLLLVAIAVAASVITYTWVMSMTGNQAQKSQTGIAMDEVLFGALTGGTGRGSTLTDGTTSNTQVIAVDATTDFVIGDFVTVYSSTVNYGTSKITAVDSSATPKTITVSPALTTAPNLDGINVKEMQFGVQISVRNSGSVATTIEGFYLYQGDALITSRTDLAYTISTGDSKVLGFASGSATWGLTGELKSGGEELPSVATDGGFAATYSKQLVDNTPYVVKLITSTGYTAEGTYYSPGSFS